MISAPRPPGGLSMRVWKHRNPILAHEPPPPPTQPDGTRN